MRLKIRGTVSMLCANTSGREENTSANSSGTALKSGASSSTPVPGLTAWICFTVSAYSHAPPSGRSSRATPVMVAWRKPIFCTLSATRRGSSRSSGSGRPVSIWQKSQRRVHWSPPMRKVASRSSQHSKMFGQPASWQTVCSSSDFTSVCSSRYCGPIRARVLIHSGFFSMGVCALRTSRRRSLRPSGAGAARPPDGALEPGWMGAWVTPVTVRRDSDPTPIPPTSSGRDPRGDQSVPLAGFRLGGVVRRALVRRPRQQLGEAAPCERCDLPDGHVTAELGAQAGDAGVADAARKEPVIPREVYVTVDREPVHGDTVADPDAEGGHLAFGSALVLGDPYAAAAGDSCGGDAEVGAGQDQRLLEAAHVVDDEDGVGKSHDRVADQLTGPVERDLPPAVDVDDRRAVVSERSLVRLGSLARRVDRWVLQQQHGVRAACDDVGVDLALQFPRGAVLHGALAEAHSLEVQISHGTETNARSTPWRLARHRTWGTIGNQGV